MSQAWPQVRCVPAGWAGSRAWSQVRYIPCWPGWVTGAFPGQMCPLLAGPRHTASLTGSMEHGGR